MPETLIAKLRMLSARLGFERDWYMIIIGAIIGTFTAFGAMGFAWTLHVVEHAVHEGQGSPGWAPWIMLVGAPMVGMGLTGVLVNLFAAEAKGHGVPQVMKALIRARGVIRPQVGIVKVVASILTVGSGGSAGTEGPIVQIGATAGSFFGQRMRVSKEHMATLVGCGAAAGISSIFNAPIAGVFFVMEILLRDFSLKTFTPIVVASVFSTATTQAFMGENEAIFAASEQLKGYEFNLKELPSYFLLGVLCGLVAVGFNRMLHKGEDFFDDMRVHPMIKPIVGALLLGVCGVAFMGACGELEIRWLQGGVPMFYGNGYETIRGLLHPDTYTDILGPGSGFAYVALGLLMVLVAVKMFATTLTLASGGSGGVFAPSLFLGAVSGAAFGVVLERIGLIPDNGSPASYALVGMAAVVAGSTHAPLTAILILFELTRDVYVLLPIMLAAVVATVVAQLVDRDSIYTAKLRRQGVAIGGGRDLTVLRRIPVSDVPRIPLTDEPIYASDPLSKLVTLHATYHVPDFVVVDAKGKYVGMVTGRDMRTALVDREAIPLLLVAELLRTDLPTIGTEESLDTVMDKFARHDVSSLCLVHSFSPGTPIGLISRANVMAHYQNVLDES